MRDIENTVAHEVVDLSAVPSGAAPITVNDTPIDGPEQAKDSIDTPVSVGSVDERIEAESLREALDDVERALARLDDGTYGTCEVCGAELEDPDLAATPQLRTCAQHRS